MTALQKLAEALSRRSAIPLGVWALGGVSLLMDTSSEMIHALLPIYLVSVMGASMEAVGIIEGVAEATASIVKVFSGALSDRLGRRKMLTAVGYGLAAISKPMFPLARSLGWVAAARFLDRVGKGIRGAPRDALIADIAPPELRGASFGLRQTLDTVGAFVGPLIAIALMAATGGAFRVVFWVGGRSGHSRRRAAGRNRQGAGSERRAGRSAADVRPRRAQRVSAAPIGWSSPSRCCLRWRASPRRSWCCGCKV